MFSFKFSVWLKSLLLDFGVLCPFNPTHVYIYYETLVLLLFVSILYIFHYIRAFWYSWFSICLARVWGAKILPNPRGHFSLLSHRVENFTMGYTSRSRRALFSRISWKFSIGSYGELRISHVSCATLSPRLSYQLYTIHLNAKLVFSQPPFWGSDDRYYKN